MLESEIIGVNVNVGHLVIAVFGLALTITWALARVTTLKPAMLTIFAVPVT